MLIYGAGAGLKHTLAPWGLFKGIMMELKVCVGTPIGFGGPSRAPVPCLVLK